MPDFFHRISVLQNFLIAGPLIGAMCALLSVYVVLRRMALISEGVSHAGFGGVAVAILLGYYVSPMDNPWWQVIITGIFCLITSLSIGYVSRRKRVSEDSAIGIFLAATVAFGAILIKVRGLLPPPPPGADGSRRASVPPSLETLLFGQFSQVVRTDVIVLTIAAVIVFAIVFALYHQFLYTTLDEEMARINGVNTRLVNTLLLMMISLVICICVRMVGFLMITALMIIPGATANMISRRFSGVLISSLLIGVLGSAAATWMAMFPPFDNYPPGPLLVLLLFAIFVVVWLYRHFIKPKPINPDAAAQPTAAAPHAFGHDHSH